MRTEFDLYLVLVTLCCHMWVLHGNSCADGSYRVAEPPFSSCSGFRHCEPGHYCINELRTACPAGRFGATPRLTNASCTGPCRAGYYCGVASIVDTALKCGSESVYCPEGSSMPLTVLAGYYSVDGEGVDSPDSSDVRCAVLPCPPGWHCSGGIRQPCAPGTYNSLSGATNSSSCIACPAGYYCESASTHPFKHPCGLKSTQYCPAGSEHPLTVGLGYYSRGPVTVGEDFTTRSLTLEVGISVGGSTDNLPAGLVGFSAASACPRGSYCLHGVRHLCPAGRYGSVGQQTNSSCSGPCTEGYYCPAGSESAQERPCRSTLYPMTS